ncbi:MAG: NYN domain-containing protein [Ignavibacteriaceae bacterium]|nr:NYN domain-containing protein [Ignavibacteriaceae bacterium]
MDKKLERVSVFVDIQNIYYTVKQIYDCHFDYSRFMSEVTDGRQLIKAIAYAIDKGDEKQIKFQKIIENLGFEIKLKPFIKRSDGSRKGDWDVGITIDILDYAKQSDVIVLASGDGDFDLLAGKIREDYKIKIEVYGVQELTATSLIEKATKFIPIMGDLLLKQ